MITWGAERRLSVEYLVIDNACTPPVGGYIVFKADKHLNAFWSRLRAWLVPRQPRGTTLHLGIEKHILCRKTDDVMLFASSQLGVVSSVV